jgi:hypothetical protein
MAYDVSLDFPMCVKSLVESEPRLANAFFVAVDKALSAKTIFVTLI